MSGLKRRCKNGHVLSAVGVVVTHSGTRRRCAVCYERWRTEDKERRAAVAKVWRKNNKARIARIEAKRQHKPARVLYTYKKNAAKRGLEFSLSDDRFFSLISGECRYCGVSNAGGVDRKDNLCGYTDGNSAPCCWVCNRMKTNMSMPDFISHAQRIADHAMRKCPHGVKIPDGDPGDKSIYCSGCYSPQAPAVPKADDKGAEWAQSSKQRQ